MNSAELYDTFRSDVVDTARPYLWTDEDVYRYMDAAYRMFVRLTGGIADFTTEEVVKLNLITGEDVYSLHPSVLRIMTITLDSTGEEVSVINAADMPTLYNSVNDYGQLRKLSMNNLPGAVRWVVQGMQKNKVKVIQIPMADDSLSMYLYRLPLTHIVDDKHDLGEVDDDHHTYLLDWMKSLAYKKQDAETVDKAKSEKAEADFTKYCAQVRREWERYKHKTRVVGYGGF